MASIAKPSTGSLVVTAAVHGKDVWYTIQLIGSRSDANTAVKTARFSEIHRMGKALQAQVPSFPGRCPPKTCATSRRRRTSEAFVENRRKELQLYLRLVTTHGAAKASNAWWNFFGDASASFDVKTSSMKSIKTFSLKSVEEGVEEDILEDSNGELGVLIARSSSKASWGQTAFNSEMGSMLSDKKTELTTAKKEEQDLKDLLASGEKAVNETVAEAQRMASLQAKAGMHLCSHLSSLEELGAKLASKKFLWEAKAHSQSELAKRFEDKLSLISESTKTAEAKVESSRCACLEAKAKRASKIDAAIAYQVEAEKVNMAAVAGHAAMAATVTVLQERAKARLNDSKAAERESDILTATQKTLVAESSKAETLRCKAEFEATTAVAAVTSHTHDAALRNHAHEAEVRRAEQCAADISALRDIQTRGQLMEADRHSCKPRENAAAAAAEKAVEALAKAQKHHEEIKAEDEQKLHALQAVAGKARKMIERREIAVKALAARMDECAAELQKSSAKQSVARAMYKAVEGESSSLKERVQGVLAARLPECASKLEEARKAVIVAGTDGEMELAATKRAEQADTQMLKSTLSEQASLVKALDESQRSAAEADEDAAFFSVGTASLSKKLDVLVESSTEGLAIKELEAKTLANDYEAALALAETARGEAEFAALDMSLTSSTSTATLYDPELNGSSGTVFQVKGDIQKRRKARKALKHVNNLEQEAQKIAKASEETAAALVDAKTEHASLQEKQKATPYPVTSLVHDELAMVYEELQTRKGSESAFLAEAQQKMADWTKQRETLCADLHHKELEVHVAQQNVQATKAMAKSCIH